MQQLGLKANYRKATGRTEVKKLRSTGQIPGVVYGAHTKPLAVQVAVKELDRVLHSASSENVLVELDLTDGASSEKRLALVQDVQHDFIKDDVLHVDFHELKADEKFVTNVPVIGEGEPVGVKTGGGILEYAMRHMKLRCLPKDLPERITVDVSNLNIGQSIHISDITLPSGVEAMDRKSLPVFIVVAPAAEEEVAATAEGAVTQPEMIKEKKVEGEEGAAPAEKAPAKGDEKKAGKAEGKEAKPEAKAEKKK